MSGYADAYFGALEEEQSARNLIYLDIPEIVCGERINNVTPRLLSVLTAVRSPWIVGGNRESYEAVAKFIWALHIDHFPASLQIPKRILKSLYKSDLYKSVAEIDAFMELTFMDASSGEKREKPIASSVTWLIYEFRKEPWVFSEERTLDTPLRKLYQELRCYRKEKGAVLLNSADKVKAEWIQSVNEWINGDPERQREFDELMEKVRIQNGGDPIATE